MNIVNIRKKWVIFTDIIKQKSYNEKMAESPLKSTEKNYFLQTDITY